MPDRIVATFPARFTVEADDDGERRTVAGVAVPYGEIGRTNLGPVRFLAGSLEPATTIPTTRDHDPTRLVGRVVDHVTGAGGINARVRISATSLGDETLTLAGDGTLDGFSVDADPIEYTYVADPEWGQVMEVTRAAWHGLALVPRPAFDGARVATVTAQRDDDPDDDEDDDDEPEDPGDPLAADRDPDDPDEDEDEDEDDDDPKGATMPATAPTINAAAPAIIPTAAPTAPAAPMDLRRLAATIAAAGGDPARIRAALTNVTTTSFAGLMRPQYVDDLVGIIDEGRPAVEAFTQRDLTGNPIMHPRWKTEPLVDVQATEKTQVASGPAEIEWVQLPAVTYAGANDLSVQLIDWGTPSAIQTYLAKMAEIYARKTEAVFEAGLIAAAADTPSTGDVFDDIGAAWGTVAASGLTPDLIMVSADVGGLLWSTFAKSAAGPVSGVISTGFGALRLILMHHAPAGTCLVGSSRAAVTYEKSDAPVEVRAVDVSLLGIDLGVYGYFNFAVDYPTALQQITGVVLPLTAAARNRKSA